MSLIRILVLLFVASFSFAQGIVVSPPSQQVLITETFTTSGSWVCPTGVTHITVQCWGGGGGGGSRGAVINTGSGGGGGGAFAQDVVAVTPGNSYDYIVGAGGTPGTLGTSNPGNPGGDTNWNSNEVLAKGGTGGVPRTGSSAGGQASASIGSIKFNGGTGSGGQDGVGGGGGGGGAGTTQNGGNGSVPTVDSTTGGGTGGSLLGGNGAHGRTAPISNGLNGSIRGGGGGGCYRTTTTDRIGGTGARGEIIITYYRQ